MLPMVETPSETVAERSARATRAFCVAVGLGSVPSKDLKLLTIALAEVAAQEAERNEEFAARVRDAFRKLTESKQPAKVRKQASGLDKLHPINRDALGRLNALSTLDPYVLVEAYGEAQVLQVLNGLPLDELKKTSAIVEERNPGTEPQNRRAKKAYVAYIMEHITGQP